LRDDLFLPSSLSGPVLFSHGRQGLASADILLSLTSQLFCFQFGHGRAPS
jgi:hypothetical protein